MKFSEYYFKPSDVIEGLNAFYKKDEENKNSDHPPFAWRMGYSKYACRFFNIKTRVWKSYETFETDRLEEAITWLREECDIFYQPGLKWEDLKYKLPDKAAEKEFGTTDIREMYPACLIRPRCCGKKIWISSNPSFRDDAFHCMNDVIATEELMREKQRIDGQEAIEGLRTLYYAVATRHERALRRLDECLGGDRDWPETTYMLEYIRILQH